MTTSLRIDEDDTTMLPLEESSCCSRSAVEIASLSCSANPLGKCEVSTVGGMEMMRSRLPESMMRCDHWSCCS